jgi:DNA replication protein DnaC
VEWAYHPCTIEIFVDQVRIGCEGPIVAVHERCYTAGQFVLDPLHYLKLLERKPGRLDNARAVKGQPWGEPFDLMRKELEYRYSQDGTLRYIQVLMRFTQYPPDQVKAAVDWCVRRRAFREDAGLNVLRNEPLPTRRAEYEALARQCSPANAPYEDFLQPLAELEVQRRTAVAIERRRKQAEFPMVKDLSSYRFGDVPKRNKKYVLDLARCQFIESRANLVISGPPGTGKTHRAIAFGREVCQRGYAVKFFTASRLVNTYLEARQERTILKLEKTIRRCDLVLVDELGYLPLDRMGAEHLFGFFSQCYEQTSLIVTTNLPFADWPQALANDERLAGALLDRLTHPMHILEIVGDSYRLKSSLEKGKEKQE